MQGDHGFRRDQSGFLEAEIKPPLSGVDMAIEEDEVQRLVVDVMGGDGGGVASNNFVVMCQLWHRVQINCVERGGLKSVFERAEKILPRVARKVGSITAIGGFDSLTRIKPQ